MPRSAPGHLTHSSSALHSVALFCVADVRVQIGSKRGRCDSHPFTRLPPPPSGSLHSKQHSSRLRCRPTRAPPDRSQRLKGKATGQPGHDGFYVKTWLKVAGGSSAYNTDRSALGRLRRVSSFGCTDTESQPHCVHTLLSRNVCRMSRSPFAHNALRHDSNLTALATAPHACRLSFRNGIDPR